MPLLEGRAWTHEQRVASATPGFVMLVSKVPGMGRGNSSISPRVTTTMGMMVSPNQPDLALDGRPVLCCPNRFTNTAVPSNRDHLLAAAPTIA